MSIQAMAWAIEHSGVKDPITKWVLVCLANYASADGSAAFPSLARLSRDTELCERAVRAHLRKLEKAIVIKRGNQAVTAAHIERSDRRPICYDILMHRGAPHAPRESTGGTTCRNGGHITTERGAPHAPDPSLSVIEPKREEGGQANPTGLPAKRVSEEEREAFKRRVKELAATPLTRRKREH